MCVYICVCMYDLQKHISYVVLTTEWLPWLQQVKEAVVILR